MGGEWNDRSLVRRSCRQWIELIYTVKKQDSETAYRLPFGFNINLRPLAKRDLRSLTKSCGDKAC